VLTRLTHGDSYAEQTTHDAIDFCVNLVIAGLRAVHGVVDILAHTETEQVGLADDEVEVLIVDLLDAFRCSSGGDLGCKVFQDGSRY
jgi:hypothetical protein